MALFSDEGGSIFTDQAQDMVKGLVRKYPKVAATLVGLFAGGCMISSLATASALSGGPLIARTPGGEFSIETSLGGGISEFRVGYWANPSCRGVRPGTVLPVFTAIYGVKHFNGLGITDVTTVFGNVDSNAKTCNP